MAELRTKYKAYVAADPAGSPAIADPQGAASRIMDLETKIAKAHETREESEDFAKGAQVWTRAELEQKAPGIDWARAARRRAAWRRAEVRRLSLRGRSRSCRAGRLGAAAELEGLARLPHAQPAGERPAQGVPRRQLRVQRHRAGRHAAAAAARHAGAQRDQQRAPGRGRQSLCRQIFPGLGQGRDPGAWSTTSRPPSPSACRRSTGWRRRPSRKR